MTGPYYWVPVPDGNGVAWRLVAFFDSDFPGGFAEHQQVWPEVMAHLARDWEKPVARISGSLADSLYGLPRGRVTRMVDGRYGIAHGNDVPVSRWISTVKAAYRLTTVAVHSFRDEHERMLAGHPENVQTALGIRTNLGLKTAAYDEDDEI